MVQKLRSSVILLSLAVISLPVIASQTQTGQSAAKTTGSTREAADMVTQAGSSYFDSILNSTNRPGWLTRTDITYSIQQKNTPVSGIETIQPLYVDLASTLFAQGRASYNDGSTTINLGLGYRYLTLDKQYMWGLNAFFDENVRYIHKRLGIGAEFFMPYVTFRANYYDALTGQHFVGNNLFERPLDGYDLGVETPVPYVSWMRFTLKGYHWEGVNASNVNGGLINLRMFPARQLEVDVGVADDNNQNGQAFLTANYYFGSPAFIEYSATTPHPNTMWAAQNLEDMRLQKVIRNNNIVVEKTSGGVGGTAVIIARGT